MLEVLSGIETENKYNVYSSDDQGNKRGEPILKAKEKSDWCARNCLS
jgi:hypothetical protein